MNFLSIEYFLAICRAGTIRKAAESLYISPQALSEHLGKLEKELGSPLFTRSNPLALTEAGKRFRTFSETCLEAKKQLEQQMTELRRREERHLSIGVPTGMAPPLLLNFLEEFHGAHPGASVSITELPTRTGILLDIPDGIDAVFAEITGHDDHVPRHTVFTSGVFVVALHRSLLQAVFGGEAAALEARAERGEAVDLTVFRDCPFVLKRSGSVNRENEDILFRAAGFSPRGVMETGDIDMAVRMTRMGNAAVVLPAPVAKVSFRVLASDPREADSILLCPIRSTGERWELAFLYDKYRPEPASLRVLAESARQYYRKLLS